MIAFFRNYRLLFTIAIWTLLIAATGTYFYLQHEKTTLQQAHTEAEALYQKLYSYRHWNAKVGGVYVPVTADTPPNPFLANLPERDIVTPSGQQLTLMNPAYMLRNMLEVSAGQFGKEGHLTSLKPINPINAPDPWEQRALEKFEQGDKVVAETRTLRGEHYLTLMRPLMVEAACLECHARQGYAIGDVRGGLSASVALAPLVAASRSGMQMTLGVHLLIWLSGLSLINRLSGRFRIYLSRSQKLQETINRISKFDKLTGLPNQSQFYDRLRWSLEQNERRGETLAVLCLDLDHFKRINSTIGHSGGNRILRDVAARLNAGLRKSDLIARLGGDSFTLLLSNLDKAEEAANVTCKILQSLNAPFKNDGQELHITASVGIALYPLDGDDAETLLKHADIALHRAKDGGRNTYEIFLPDMNEQILARMNLENDLRRALKKQEFELHYQPQVDAITGQLTGAEALLRWQHPQKGLVGPQDFIPVAEENGLIVPIGEWVLRDVCRQIRAWEDQGLEPVRIAVNLSPRQFQEPDLVQMVEKLLSETNVSPEQLTFEITESAIMQNADQAITALVALRGLGIHIAIDDFGTGYSSLSHLKLFPIDVLKIDRSFIHDLPGDADSVSIVSAIVAMARNLNLKVLAEGAETEEQHTFLRSLECDEIQGFLFSPPVSAGEFRELLSLPVKDATDSSKVSILQMAT